MDAMIRAAGFRNLDARAGYGAISLERMVMAPPSLIATGFYDQEMAAYERWSIGREGPLRRLIASRATVALPGAILTCPAWFVADGSAALAAWARTHP
jgi:iron complex transport system substrate-binding protein